MRKLITTLALISLTVSLNARTGLPREVPVKGVFPHHVQGMAVDTVERCFYLSFTDRFIKTDYEGNIIASVDAINGHIGAMTYDYETRTIYASLEYKDDEIGSAISKSLGRDAYDRENSHFCIAVIDPGELKGMGTPVSDVMVAHEVGEATRDYKTRYGCSGIDGITIAPPIGRKKGRRLYVAYGIYSDTSRRDNDHQIILEYKFNHLFAPSHKYFVFTGNTTYGVQNMAYDKATGNIFLACYGGMKEQYPNFSLFAVPQSQKPKKKVLTGLEEDGRHDALDLADDGIGKSGEAIRGWMFSKATTGFCSLGNGLWYVAEARGRGGKCSCTIRLYQWTDERPSPFKPAE